jgi:uncharacterized protein YfaS (alpha-2-macroglobulin family)
MLEHLYDLLDEAEERTFQTHLRDCSSCQEALEKERAKQKLLAAAALGHFPQVNFSPPVDVPTSTLTPAASPSEAAAVSTPPHEQATLPLRPMANKGRAARLLHAMAPWFAAAAVLLIVSTLAWSVLRPSSEFLAAKEFMENHERVMVDARAKVDRLGEELANLPAERTIRLGELQRSIEQRELHLVVTGPRNVQPGAPAEFSIRTSDLTGKPTDAVLDVSLLNGSVVSSVSLAPRVTGESAGEGKALESAHGTADAHHDKSLQQQSAKSEKKEAKDSDSTFEKALAKGSMGENFKKEMLGRSKTREELTITPVDVGEYKVTIPPTTPFKTGQSLDLLVSARKLSGAAGKEPVQLSGKLHLSAPVSLTHLATDKPMYQPGEVVRFRSLTLDRETFRPAADDLRLSYSLTAPNGSKRIVARFAGTLMQENGPKTTPLLGPDQKPIRGIGAGEVVLEEDVAGGEYTLSVSEDSGRFAPVMRTFLVNRYQKPRLDKTLDFSRSSYGPSDVVAAKLTVKRAEGGVAKNVPLDIAVHVDDQSYSANGRVGPGWQGKTDEEGTYTTTFTLPSQMIRGNASLSVTVRDLAVTETIVRPIPVVLNQLKVDFYPEGGDLVADLPSRVYFQARTMLGKPAQLRGVLLEDEKPTNIEVATLSDDTRPGVNQGNGVFSFTPKKGKSYAVQITSPRGLVDPVPLPAAREDGVTLQIEKGVFDSHEAIKVRVGSNRTRKLIIGAYCRGQLLDLVQLNPNQGEAVLRPKVGAGGVCRVTVFEELPTGKVQRELRPVAERLVYRHPKERLDVSLQAEKRRYLPGESVKLQVATTDENEQMKPSIALVGVVDQSVVTLADDKTKRSMPTYFLLTNEVRNPEDLEYADFLLSGQPKAAESLDLLLGTQGWRRFAEQNPQQFRDRLLKESESLSEPERHRRIEEAERLLVMSGQSNPQQTNLDREQFAAVEAEFDKRTDQLVEEHEKAQEQARTATTSEQYKQAVQLVHRWTTAHENTRQGGTSVTILVLLALMLAALAARAHRKHARSGLFALLAAACAVALVLLSERPHPETAADQPPERLLARLGMDVKPPEDQRDPPDGGFGRPIPVVPEMAGGRRFLEGGVVNLGGAPGVGNPGAPGLGNPGGGGGFGMFGAFGAAPTAPPGAVPVPPVGLVDRWAEQPPALRPADPRSATPAPRMIAPEPAPAQGVLEKAKAEPQPDNANRDGGGGRGSEKGTTRDSRVRKGAETLARGSEGQDKPKAIQSPPPGMPTLKQKRSASDAARRWLDAAAVDGRRYAPEKDRFPPRAEFLREERGRKQTVEPQIALVREYAFRASPEGRADARNQFVETLAWFPVLVLPEGKAEVQFDLGDSVTSYEAFCFAHTLDGRLGVGRTKIEAQLPFVLAAKVPAEVTATDRLDISVGVVNSVDVGQPAEVKLGLVKGLQSLEELSKVAGPGSGVVPGGAGVTYNPSRFRRQMMFRPTLNAGLAELEITGKAGLFEDRIRESIRVVPDGFPMQGAFSDLLEGSATHRLSLPSWVEGTLNARVEIYPSSLAHLQSGLEALLQEPHGCFEQTSSTNYPNVLILKYLQTMEKADPTLERRTRQLLEVGYRKLLSFECEVPGKSQRRGYEWFGGAAPPHEALTAYGLMQFVDMDQVMKIDRDMLARTRQFLLDQRDGEGGFRRNTKASGAFGRATPEITNAYIVWALSQTGDANNLEKEITWLKQRAEKSNDSYFLALTALALSNSGQHDQAKAFLTRLAAQQQEAGWLDSATSITSSGGQSLQIETTALAILAWLKADALLYRPAIEKAIGWLAKQRNGTFGSTQSTILALKALIAHAQANKRPLQPGELRLLIGEREVNKVTLRGETQEVVSVSLPASLLKQGDNKIRVEITGQKHAIPHSLLWTCRTAKPESVANCPLELQTTLAKPMLAEGELVRLSVTVANKTGQDQGMATAIIGLPAGLSLPEDLKQLKEYTRIPSDGKAPQLGAFEIRGRELILYWREIAKDQTHTLPIDLVARVPGVYRGPASRAYLYYDAQKKHWHAPLSVTIAPK